MSFKSSGWAFYNDNDPACCRWLKNLIDAGLLPKGDVDNRSIKEIDPDELQGYRQCHFFAGIGGWPLALRLTEWPGDRQVWTGSCPCQPFSVAGKRKGVDDSRHLWPDFYRLIRASRPAVVFGEQVGGKAGEDWLDGVRSDLEGEGYWTEAVDVPAGSVNAPHRRQRLYWVADRPDDRCRQERKDVSRVGKRDEEERRAAGLALRGPVDGLGQSDQTGRKPRIASSSPTGYRSATQSTGGFNVLAHALGPRLEGREVESTREEREAVERGGGVGELAILQCDAEEQGRTTSESSGRAREDGTRTYLESGRSSLPRPWHDFDAVDCLDGKSRRIEPGPQQMADGFSEFLGCLCSATISKIEKEMSNASISEDLARQALFVLWSDNAALAIQRKAGRCHSVYEAPVLLTIMRELARKGWKFLDHFPSACWESAEAGLRAMRTATSEITCTPQGRGPIEQYGRQLADTLSILSQTLAFAAEEAGMIPFPLIKGVPNRMVKLRGYGNAIVPPLAAEFVRSYLDTHGLIE